MRAHKTRFMGFMATKPVLASKPSAHTKAVGREAVRAETCRMEGPRNRRPSELTFGEGSQTLEELRAELESL